MSRVMGGALRRARCGRLASQALALLVVMAGFAFVTAPAAQAASLTLGKEAPASELAGANITYKLTATNPNVAGAAPEYNITFRDELPVGVAYVPGSTTESYFGEPTIITAADGHQILIWDNVADLPVGADLILTFKANPDETRYPVGTTVANSAQVYGQTNPRLLAQFDAAGVLVPGTATQSASTPAVSTAMSAIKIRKAEASPEAELLRGIHDHPTRYTLTVSAAEGGSTSGVVVVDYLPAGLEFLGCGTVDNSSGPEYPGAPSLTATPDVPACVLPTRVETVTNPPGRPAGVYTRVEWALGTMAAGSVQQIVYAAGIPQRANVAFPAGGPTPTSLGQVANLDNNTGASTRELSAELGLVNYADAAGTYNGPIAPGASRSVTDTTSHTVTAEDVSMQKTVSPTEFQAGGVARYTLTINLSEYADASGIVVKDLLADGMCPLSTTTNFAPGGPAECAPGAGFPVTGANYANVIANANGTFDITFTPVAGQASDVLTITYYARMRRVYGSTGLPTVSGDDFPNTASLTGTTTPAPGVGSPDAGPAPVTDGSQVELTTDGPTLDKRIQPDADPMTCSTNRTDYVNPEDVPAGDFTYDEGSRVCFLVRINFSGTNSTRNPVLTDFLPTYATYEAGSAVITAGSQPAVLSTTDPMRWDIGTLQGTARYAPPDTFFEVRFSALVTKPGPPGAQPTITANLAKFTRQSTGNKTVGLRDKTEFKVTPPPPAAVLKSAVRVADGTAVPEGGTVVADERLRYTVALTNNGSAAAANNEDMVGPDVWDILPAGVTCAQIAAISNGGQCTNPGQTGHPTFTGNTLYSAIRWNLPDSVRVAPGATLSLTYEMTVPSNASVSASYVNTASPASYGTASNIGTVVQHYPATNIDTSVPATEIDVPAARDTHTVVTPNVTVAKTNTTSVNEAGNALAGQAVIGEVVTYSILAQIPAHTSVYDGVLTDVLPAGMEFTGASADFSTDAGATFGALPAGFVLGANGTLTLPSSYANATGVAHVARVQITARVRNVAGNTNGTVLTNTASFASKTAPGGAALPVRQGTSRVTVVTPAPTIAKTDNDADKVVTAGQTVTYTLTVTNAAGRPPAHDMFVVDCVPALLAVTGILPGSPNQGTAAYAPSTGADGCASGTTRMLWNVGDLAPGTSRTLSYTAVVDDSVGGLATLTNRATQTSSTLDDNSVAPGVDNPAELVITQSATDTIQVRAGTTTKTVDQALHAIGERATYTVQVRVPADVNLYDAALIDTLPAGLDPTTLQTVSVDCARADATTCPVTATPLTRSGGIIGWALGDLTRDTQLRTITIVYSAVVADVAANVAGRVQTNSAVLRWNTVNGTTPTSVTGTWTAAATPATATFTETEPRLAIDKTVSDATPDPGQVFTYSVAVSNATGTTVSAAHNITVVDTVPVGVVVTAGSISNGGVLTGGGANGGGTITWTLPGPIAPGALLTLTYDAELAAPALTATLTNTADITKYTSTAAGGRSYDGPSDTAQIRAALPHVSSTKTVLGGDIAYIGEAKSWQLLILSDGESTAYGVDAVDTLPANWSYVAGSALVSINGGAPVQIEPDISTAGAVSTLTWSDLATLAVRDRVTITFSAEPTESVVDDAGVGRTIDHKNTLQAVAEDASGNTGPQGGGSYAGPPSSAVAHIHSADVVMVKAHTGAPVAGQPFSWTLTVSNAGPDTAVGPFTVVDTLPDGLSGVVVGGTGWTCTVDTDSFTCVRTDPTNTLASGASFPVITITADVPSDVAAGSELVNEATVNDRTYDPKPDNNTDSDSATVTAVADFSLDKTLVGEIVAGQQASYTLDVVNLGPSVSRGEITIEDTLPAGSTFVSAEGTGWDCSADAGVLTCTRDDLVALGTLPQISVTIAIPSDQIDPVVNTATVSAPLDDNPDNDTDEVTTDPVTRADLAITKSSQGAFVAGQDATYRLTVSNLGASDAQSVVRITDALPAELSYVTFTSVTGTWTCSAAGQDLSCDLSGALAAGDTVVVEVTVHIDPDHVGDVTNSATVSSPTTDPVPANNTDQDNTGSNVEADLQMAKTHAGDAVAGQQISYDLAVHNAGPSRSPGPITVVDNLPAGMTYASFSGAGWSCSAAGQTVTCTNAGSIAAGGDAPTLTLTTDVAPDAGPATLTNRATVDGPISDPDLTNNADADPTVVADEANLSLSKTVVGDNPVVAGTRTSYSLVAHNDGPSDADSVSVFDVLPAGMSLVSADGPGWTCEAEAPVSCHRDSIPAVSDAPSITVIVEVGSGVADGTTLTNNASTSTSTPGDDPADNDATADVEVIARADLALSKTHPAEPVMAGTDTDFVLTVSNEGESDAVGPLTIVDSLPDGMSFVTASAPWTCSAAGQQVTCTLTDGLVAGATATELVLTAHVDAAVDPTTLTNSATVSSSTVDPNPDNNDATADVEVAETADLTIVKSHTGPGLVRGQVTFTLAVSNAGPSAANEVTVEDSLPAGLTLASVSADGWECSTVDDTVACVLTGDLGPDEMAPPITVVADVHPNAYPGVTNVATVDSTAMDPWPDDNTSSDAVEVPPLVDLALAKHHTGVAKVGQELTFELVVTNHGPTPDPGPITVTDQLPVGLTYVSATGEGWVCSELEQAVTCVADAGLDVDASSTITLVTSVEPSAYPLVTNVGMVATESTETDAEDPANNVAQDPVEVVPLVELDLAKSLKSLKGDTATFTLTVTNKGPNDTVEPLVVTDRLPNGLDFESARGAGWACVAPANRVTCTYDATLAVGAKSTITLVTTVVGHAGQQITNVGTVSGGGSDVDATDDALVKVPPSGGLPNTGGTSWGWIPLGLFLIVLGGLLLRRSLRGQAT